MQTSPGDLDSYGYHGDYTLCLLALDLIGGSWKSDLCLSTLLMLKLSRVNFNLSS